MVFLHAGVADRRSWYPVMQIVGKDYRAVAYDQRGYGDTTYAAEAHSAVADLVAVLDDLALDQAVLVGCSRGGQLAYEATFRVPERVAALVLVDSAPQGAPQTDLPPVVQDLAAALDDAEERGDLERVNQLEARIWLDGPEAPSSRVGGDARELFLDMNRRALTAAPKGEEEEFVADWDQLTELDLPTLVMVGSLDLPSVIRRADLMGNVISGTKLITLDGAAHLPMLECPSLVAGHLLEFLGGLDL